MIALSVYLSRVWRRILRQHGQRSLQGVDQIQCGGRAAPKMAGQGVLGMNAAAIGRAQNAAGQFNLYGAVQGSICRGEIEVNNGRHAANPPSSDAGSFAANRRAASDSAGAAQ